MFNIKKIFSPTGAVKSVNTIRSWTLSWKISKAGFSDYLKSKPKFKVFTNEEDAKDYREKLEKANKFVENEFDLNCKITEN